jgi:hypothetical protein
MVGARETAVLAEKLISETAAKQGIGAAREHCQHFSGGITTSTSTAASACTPPPTSTTARRSHPGPPG